MRLTSSHIDRFVRAAEHYYRAEQETLDRPANSQEIELRNCKRLHAWHAVMLKREALWRVSVGLP